MASNVKDDFQDFADRALRVPGIFAKGLADKFNDQFQRELSAVQWDWPRKTTRVNGSVVTSPRDIVNNTFGASDSPVFRNLLRTPNPKCGIDLRTIR